MKTVVWGLLCEEHQQSLTCWNLSCLQHVAFVVLPTLAVTVWRSRWSATTSGRSENASCTSILNLFFCTSWGPFYASHSPYVDSLTIFFSVRYSSSHTLSLTDLTALSISGMDTEWTTRDLFSLSKKIGSYLTFYKKTCQPLCILRRS